MMCRISYVVLFHLLLNACFACLLCPLHLPPRPRPIDHFLLPSVEHLELPESVAVLCNNTKNLPLTNVCGQQVSEIVCSISEFIFSQTTTCNTSDSQERCVECLQRKSVMTEKNFWAISCKYFIVTASHLILTKNKIVKWS